MANAATEIQKKKRNEKTNERKKNPEMNVAVAVKWLTLILSSFQLKDESNERTKKMKRKKRKKKPTKRMTPTQKAFYYRPPNSSKK